MSNTDSDFAASQIEPAAAAGEPQERSRLAAVVFTDVVGYSARMQTDEAATISAVHADFTRMREASTQLGGEVLNTMGDGMMLCFGSAVDAVTFALQTQAEFAKRNAELPSGQGLMHRVGIHIGDVRRVEGGHLAGDGVNIAARLEPKAPKGGICISQIVYDTVKRKIPMQADCMGPQTFKNISEPITIWRIAPEGKAKPPPPPVHVEARRTSNPWVSRLVALCVVLFAADFLWPYREWLKPDHWDAGLANMLTAFRNAVAWAKAMTGSGP
jgi:class 3 adenylate cyclase